MSRLPVRCMFLQAADDFDSDFDLLDDRRAMPLCLYLHVRIDPRDKSGPANCPVCGLANSDSVLRELDVLAFQLKAERIINLIKVRQSEVYAQLAFDSRLGSIGRTDALHGQIELLNRLVAAVTVLSHCRAVTQFDGDIGEDLRAQVNHLLSKAVESIKLFRPYWWSTRGKLRVGVVEEAVQDLERYVRLYS